MSQQVVYPLIIMCQLTIIGIMCTCVLVRKICTVYSATEPKYSINNALVIIIGVAKFDDKDLADLPGVPKCVKRLKQQWEGYNYDVVVFNENVYNSTKDEIIDLCDIEFQRISTAYYDIDAVIVHVLSHGNGDRFSTSNNKEIAIDFLCSELTKALRGRPQTIKIVFDHCCRRRWSYHLPNSSVRYPGLYILQALSDSSSDKGYFTDSIVTTFKRNLERLDCIKYNLHTLIGIISTQFAKQTDNDGIVRRISTVQHPNIVFFKNKSIN